MSQFKKFMNEDLILKKWQWICVIMAVIIFSDIIDFLFKWFKS